MNKCRCLKVPLSEPADGGINSAYFCCGQCDVADVSKAAKTMRICITPQHMCRAERLVRVDAAWLEYYGFPGWASMMKSADKLFHDRPDFIEYCGDNDRLGTFDNWPKRLKQTPEQLALAGFFYTQKADRVICFWCGLGLWQWEEGDDVWEQHALHRGDCEYVQLLKTPEYVTSIKMKFAVDEPDISTLSMKD